MLFVDSCLPHRHKTGISYSHVTQGKKVNSLSIYFFFQNVKLFLNRWHFTFYISKLKTLLTEYPIFSSSFLSGYLSRPRNITVLVSNITSVLFRPLWQVQECPYSGFSCRLAYYLTVRDILYPPRPRCQLTLPAPPLPPTLFCFSLLSPWVLGQASCC